MTEDDVVTASGKYPDRAKSSELTDEVKSNISDLISRVNALLQELGIGAVKVSSGFRPSAVNASIPNAAKKSAHISGKAVDLEDADGKLDFKFKMNPELLRKHGLFLEDPIATPGWAHLDCVARADRPSRTFKP